MGIGKMDHGCHEHTQAENVVVHEVIRPETYPYRFCPTGAPSFAFLFIDFRGILGDKAFGPILYLQFVPSFLKFVVAGWLHQPDSLLF
jgi:hypothetical protein